MGHSSREKKKKHKKKHKRDESSTSSEETTRKKLARKVAKTLTSEAGGSFVWAKKIEKQIAQGATVEDITKQERERGYKERMEEIEKVRRRREEREKEREALLAQREQEQRQKMRAEAVELEAKEEQFHLDQAILGALKRLKDGRARPLDPIVVAFLDPSSEAQAPLPKQAALSLPASPCDIFPDTLPLKTSSSSPSKTPAQNPADILDDILVDILHMQQLDSKDPLHARFWDALATVARARRADVEGAPNDVRMLRDAISTPTRAPLEDMLAGKTYEELCDLEKDIEKKLEDARVGLVEVAIDPEYWAGVLERLTIAKARALVDEIYRRSRIFSTTRRSQQEHEKEEQGKSHHLLRVGELPSSPKAEAHHDLSPRALAPEDYAGQRVIPEEEDWQAIEALRTQAGQQGATRLPQTLSTRGPRGGGEPTRDHHHHQQEDLLFKEVMALERDNKASSGFFKNIVSDESLLEMAQKRLGTLKTGDAHDAPFGGEVSLASAVQRWHAQYRPRKPKYFNRVHTGFDWNKYNQAHYDVDNPPPKMVVGYKFNIFYPDLVDPSKTPSYSLEPDEGSEDGSTCILRFHAGPPYEDVAFRILNKEWEYNHKRGFKCVFDKGMLCLHFNFKREWYRR